MIPKVAIISITNIKLKLRFITSVQSLGSVGNSSSCKIGSRSNAHTGANSDSRTLYSLVTEASTFLLACLHRLLELLASDSSSEGGSLLATSTCLCLGGLPLGFPESLVLVGEFEQGGLGRLWTLKAQNGICLNCNMNMMILTHKDV